MSSSQKGQIVIIFLLVIVVVLAVGLSSVGRSVTEISTSSKTEDSSRAFSAAEAGLEKALKAEDAVPAGTLENQAQFDVSVRKNLPEENVAIGHDSVEKNSIVQFWLANPAVTPLAAYYTQSSFDLYFGDPRSYSLGDEPAVEVNVVSWNATAFISNRYYFDSASTARDASFSNCASVNSSGIEIDTDSAGNKRKFYCRVNISGYPSGGGNFPVVVRVKVLYGGKTNHPMALKPTGGCGPSCSLPPQKRVYTSIGNAGNSQRRLEVTQFLNVIPQIFDYSLFAMGELNKL